MTVDYGEGGIGDPGGAESVVGPGSVITLLKRIRTLLSGALAVTGPIDVEVNGNIGEQTMAASLPVVVASDQADVPITLDGEAVDIEIGGVAPQLDDTDKIAVSLYGDNVVAGDVPVAVSADGRLSLGVLELYNAPKEAVNVDVSVQRDTVAGFRFQGIVPYLWNGATLDAKRNNAILALLASAARTATATSPTQTNYNWRGFVLSVDVTARAAATTLTPSLQIQATGGDWKTIWTAAAAINTANASYVYLFYPGVIASGAALYVEELDLTFGRTWRVVITHNDANSITYSVGAEMIL